jgi:hypothetical protein
MKICDFLGEVYFVFDCFFTKNRFNWEWKNIYVIMIGKDCKFMKDNNVYCINRNFIL